MQEKLETFSSILAILKKLLKQKLDSYSYGQSGLRLT